MTDTKKPTAAEVAIAEIREYFEDRQDASMEPGEDRFHGNKEMGLLEEVATVERALLRLSDVNSRWVRTDEREPSDEQWVVGYYAGYSPCLSYQVMQFFAADATDSHQQWRSSDGKNDRPLYWMPLPEPPK